MLTITVDANGQPSAPGFSNVFRGNLCETYSETDILRSVWQLWEIME